MVDDPEFRYMVNVLDPSMHVPVRNTVKRRLVSVEKNVRVALRKQLEDVWDAVPSLTTDHWTSSTNEGYASFTIHYVSKAWILESVSLGVIPFARPHTAIRVAELTEGIRKDLGWPDEPMPTITTDNAAVMRAAFEKELG